MSEEMSEQQPQPSQPAPDSAQVPAANEASPSTPTTPASTSQSGSESPALQTVVAEKLKVVAIASLRFTGQGLGRAADNLEGLPSAEPILPPALEEKRKLLWQKFLPLWLNLLTQIRPRLPEQAQQLSDRSLSAILVGILLLLFWITSSLLSPHGSRVATQPAPRSTVATRPALQRGNSNRAIPAPNPSFPTDLTAPSSSPTSSPIVVASKSDPKPSEPKLTTPAAPKLTPEQQKIATLQAQLTALGDRYSPDLITATQENSRNTQLRVTVNPPAWYGLSAQQQNQLAAELLSRSQGLEFTHLELRDPRGILLARSPVVGSAMVILKRAQEPPALT